MLDAGRDQAGAQESAGKVIVEHRASIPLEKEPSCQPGMKPKARSGGLASPESSGCVILCSCGSRRLLASLAPP